MVTLYVLIALVNNVHSSCGYVDLSASIDLSGLSVPVGEFTLSLNECQSLWIPVLEVVCLCMYPLWLVALRIFRHII